MNSHVVSEAAKVLSSFTLSHKTDWLKLGLVEINDGKVKSVGYEEKEEDEHDVNGVKEGVLEEGGSIKQLDIDNPSIEFP